METVQFGARQTDLSDRCRAKIAKLADWLEENPTVVVGLAASAGASSSEDSRLAADRVEAVRAALVGRGIGADRIRVGPFSDRAGAVCAEATERCQASNRSVEVLASRN